MTTWRIMYDGISPNYIDNYTYDAIGTTKILEFLDKIKKSGVEIINEEWTEGGCPCVYIELLDANINLTEYVDTTYATNKLLYVEKCYENFNSIV